jgi:hypothetical protein
MREEGPREYHVNSQAANELDHQSARAALIIERLAADLAAAEPDRPDHLRTLVEREHVVRAAEILFGSTAARETPVAGTTQHVFVSYSTRDREFVKELTRDLSREHIGCFVADRSIRTASD